MRGRDGYHLTEWEPSWSVNIYKGLPSTLQCVIKSTYHLYIYIYFIDILDNIDTDITKYMQRYIVYSYIISASHMLPRSHY